MIREQLCPLVDVSGSEHLEEGLGGDWLAVVRLGRFQRRLLKVDVPGADQLAG